MKRAYILFIVLISVFVLGWHSLAQPESAPTSTPAVAPASSNVGGGTTYVTPNTTRLYGPNDYAAATAITQATYGATHHEDRPHAITLVRADRQADAMLGASRITHFPVNSPCSMWTPIGCRLRRSLR